MTRWIMVGAVVSLAGAVGCDGTPQTIATAKPVSGGDVNKSAVQIAPGKAPAQSDPKAAELIAAAVAAHTGGKPELLQKLKTVRYVREGKVSAGGLAEANQKWEVHAGWPDRFRVRAEMLGQQVVTLVWSGTAGWRHATGLSKIPMTEQEVSDFRHEVTGEWLELLFPLTEPGAVVALAEDAKVNNRPAGGVRVWHPSLSDAVLHFDKETRLLVRLAYDGRETGQKVTKEVLVQSHKEFAGVKLPEQTVYKSNGAEFADWRLTAAEPLDKLDAKLFEEP
ncbi:MAG TPA: hypothetical protein VM533_12825 [Fimbriiglobus sp.]|nr:hypothetical protein [Fimbriiglobus sp.]